MPSWDDVLAIAGRLPDVEAATSYGTPSLKVRGKFMCRLRTDPDALVVRVIDLADRDALILGDPDVYFITPHYREYPAVLVRMDRVDRAELEELIEDAWRLKAPKRLVAAWEAERA